MSSQIGVDPRIKIKRIKLPWKTEPEKNAVISRRQNWFPSVVTSVERAQKFHTDDDTLPRSV